MATDNHGKRYLVIPCVALVAAALHPGHVWAESPMRSPAPGASLTDVQKRQVFEARRRWELGSIDRQKALLAAKQRCIQASSTPSALLECHREQRQGRRALFQEGRAAMKAELQRLGLPPRPGRSELQKKGRSIRNGTEFS